MVSYLGVVLSLLYITDLAHGCHYSCPTGKYTWQYHNLCIQVHYNQVEWDKARPYCRESGGDLLAIRTKTIQDFVVSHLKKTGRSSVGYWFGATDRKQESKWQWVNGDVAMHYSNWAAEQGTRHPGFLFGGLEDCALMKPKTGYTWHDAPCNSPIGYRYAFLCQFNAIKVPDKPHIKITTHLPKTTTTTHKPTTRMTTLLSTAVHIPEGECPSCHNETDLTVCSSHTTVCRGAEACFLQFTQHGANAGCISDSIQCFRNMSHMPAECNFRPIPFKSHPNLNCLYCCDLSKENCFEGLLKLVVYDHPPA